MTWSDSQGCTGVIQVFWSVMLCFGHIAANILKNCSTFSFSVQQSKIKGTTVLQTVPNCSPSDMTARPHRPESSETPLWEPQMLHEVNSWYDFSITESNCFQYNTIKIIWFYEHNSCPPVSVWSKLCVPKQQRKLAYEVNCTRQNVRG